MAILRKQVLKSILDPNSKLDDDFLEILMAIFSGQAAATACLANYSSKRSFDTALSRKGVFNLFESNIINPLRGNQTARLLLQGTHLEDKPLELDDKSWKKSSNLAFIIDVLGFNIFGLTIDEGKYSVIQSVDGYKYSSIVEFVEISSSSVLRRIGMLDKRDKIPSLETIKPAEIKLLDEIKKCNDIVKKSVAQLDKLDKSMEKNKIIEILKELIDIACAKNMAYYIPTIIMRIATCYYHIGAYADCIAMFDFGFDVANDTSNPTRRKYLASHWIASSARHMLSVYPDYFTRNPEEFEKIYELVKEFNRKSFYDYQTSEEILIPPMWNLCCLELYLMDTYRGTSLEFYKVRMSLAADRLYELIQCIKRKKTNFSKEVKSEIIRNLDSFPKDMLDSNEDFVDLCNQLRNLNPTV
jgi:hypothetical protein